jgi:hypothetical protein
MSIEAAAGLGCTGAVADLAADAVTVRGLAAAARAGLATGAGAGFGAGAFAGEALAAAGVRARDPVDAGLRAAAGDGFDGTFLTSTSAIREPGPDC